MWPLIVEFAWASKPVSDGDQGGYMGVLVG